MARNIFTRVSVREFENKMVEDEKIEDMLRAAMAAPSAGNQQPWEYYVIKDKSVLEQISMSSPYAGCAKDAPVAFVACYRTEGICFPEYAEIDMGASVENLLLEATEHHLGAVWLGIAPVEERMEKVAEILHLPKNLKAFAIIPCGYPIEQLPQENRFDKQRVHYV